MRTDLKDIKNKLFSGIVDKSYKHYLSNNASNQRAFLMAFFPLAFLRQEENSFLIEIRSNNSSRLSNIFNRRTDPKRNEQRFRERFIAAFDTDFFEEMVQSCQFFLRNYNTDEFNHMIEQILDEDEELTALENKEIFEYIQKFYMTSPGKTLALVILWAFHTESFDPIVEVIEDYESCNVDQKPDDDNNQIMYEHANFFNQEVLNLNM